MCFLKKLWSDRTPLSAVSSLRAESFLKEWLAAGSGSREHSLLKQKLAVTPFLLSNPWRLNTWSWNLRPSSIQHTRSPWEIRGKASEQTACLLSLNVLLCSSLFVVHQNQIFMWQLKARQVSCITNLRSSYTTYGMRRTNCWNCQNSKNTTEMFQCCCFLSGVLSHS